MPLVETRYGQFAVPDTAEDLIGQFLSRYGEWAWDEVVFVASNLAPGARVLDVGAYLGTFGLGLSLRQHLASVCYVEANPNVAPLLRDNIRRLKRQPSQVVAALAYAGGEPPTTGHIDGTNWGALSFAPNASGEVFAQPPEAVVTLAELRELHGPFDLIKLDVEGMERELIESDAEFFRSGRCLLWLECNEHAASLDLINVLLGLELDVYYFAFPSYNPNNYRNDPAAIFPFAFEGGLLAGRHLAPELDPSLQAHGCLLRPIRSAEDLRQALWRTPRWGLKEWEARSASEVAALASRILLGQEYDSFIECEAGAGDWRGALALVDQLRRTEARLQAYEASLEDECGDDGEARIRRLVEREGLLRAQLQVQVESGEQLAAELGEMRRAVVERDGHLRSLEARLSEVRALASERLFQLSILASRANDAEQVAADAHARLLQLAQQKAQENERFAASEQALRQELDTVQGALSAAQARGWSLRRFKNKRIYRNSIRPFIKRIRRLFKPTRSKQVN